MNAATINRTSFLFAFGLPALIIIAATIIAFTPLIVTYPELAIGVTYDLTLSAPLLYLFLIRKTNLPKTTVILFFVGGVFIASFLLPKDQQFHLNIVKLWLLPVVEISGLAFISFSAYRTFQTYKSFKGKSSDVFTILRETCRKPIKIPMLANVFAFEIAVLYYTFFSWKKFKPNEQTFSYHKKNGTVILFGVIIFLITVETLVFHILIIQWNVIVAWILTISSLYVSLQLFAHIKAIFQRPIEITGGKLFVRYGLFGDSEIDLQNIEKIEFSSVLPDEKEGVKRLSLLGELEQFNTKIHLKNEAELNGFYGIKSNFKTLLLYIDETEKFKKLIEQNDSN